MNKEEKKAICLLKALNNLEKKCKIEKVPYKTEIKKIRISLLPEDYGIFEILLNLIVKLQKENIEQKAEIERRKHDNKTLKEFVSAVFNEELNNKYILTDKQNNAVIENAQNDINQKWIQKVEDKIEELDIKISECEYSDDDDEEYKKAVEKDKLFLLNQKRVLQELLEKRK